MNSKNPFLAAKIADLVKRLPLLEAELRDRIECDEIFDAIKLRKNSFSHALSIGNHEKAFYEAVSLEDHIIELLTEL